MTDPHEWMLRVAVGMHYNGLDSVAAAHAADAAMGQGLSLDTSLYTRCKEMIALLEAWREQWADRDRRRTLTRGLHDRVDALYGPDLLCPKHTKWVHEFVDEARHRGTPKTHGMRLRGHMSWNYALAIFAEQTQKWLMKTGCEDCPMQQYPD